MKVDWSIHDAWLQWMRDIHIPAILFTGCFEKHQLLRLIDTDDTEGPTYALLLYAENQDNYNKYSDLHQPALNRAMLNLWSHHVLTFSTLMQVVH